MNEELEKIDLYELVMGLWRSIRHFFLRGVALMIALAAVLVWQTRAEYVPYYEASASFTVHVTNNLYSGQQYYNNSAAAQMADTFPHILTSGVLSARVRAELGIDSMPSVSASAMGETNIFTLKVRSTDPQLSYDVLNCVIKNYPEVAEFVVGPTTLTLLSESGVPVRPTAKPDYKQAAMMGAMAGAGVWALMSFAYWMSHRTVASEEELKKVVNLPCIGRLPKVGGVKKKACPVLDPGNDKFGFSESVRLLRVRVEKAMAESGGRVLLVSSSIANEGKTTVSINLALAMAQKGKRTLLVDCDLRNPSVARALGMDNQAGMSEYLNSRIDLERTVKESPMKNLHIITGGKTVSHPEDLLTGSAMQRFIDAVRGSYDFVILDTPPCGLMADAAELCAMADAAVLTVRQDHANRSQIAEGAMMLTDSKKPILGCVLNMTRPRLLRGGSYGAYNYYGYGYGYGYYGGKKGEVLDDEA